MITTNKFWIRNSSIEHGAIPAIQGISKGCLPIRDCTPNSNGLALFCISIENAVPKARHHSYQWFSLVGLTGNDHTNFYILLIDSVRNCNNKNIRSVKVFTWNIIKNGRRGAHSAHDDRSICLGWIFIKCTPGQEIATHVGCRKGGGIPGNRIPVFIHLHSYLPLNR